MIDKMIDALKEKMMKSSENSLLDMMFDSLCNISRLTFVLV